MMAKPITRVSSRATRTLTLAAQILASIRCAVHFHCNPYSIKTRDMRAIAEASERRAKDNERSECVMARVSAASCHRTCTVCRSLPAKASIRVAETEAVIHMQFENASANPIMAYAADIGREETVELH